MQTPQLTIQKLFLKTNKNNTGYNNSLTIPTAVVLLNEAAIVWVKNKLKYKDSIKIDYLQEIVLTDVLLNGEDKENYTEYLVPGFYELILVNLEAQKKNCKKFIYSKEIKNQNLNISLFDSNQEPDFDFEWTFHQVLGNKLLVYKKDFNIKKVNFTYYSIIPEFDIEGYTTISGVPSINKPFTLSDQYIDQIIDVATENFFRNIESNIGLSIAQNRTKTQE